jgi:hypothetical protein
METLDGKDTIHATVGTCYQNKTENNESDDNTEMRSGWNRQHFDGLERVIPPYTTE